MKKRILFIASSPLYLEKGSSLRMYEIAKNLSTKYNLDIATYSLGRNFSIKNAHIYRTPKWFKPELKVGKPSFSKIILDFFILIKSLRLIYSNNYEIIHCEDFEGAFIGYILSFFTNSKLVYDLHNRITDNLDISLKKNKFKKVYIFIEKLVLKKFDLVILNWAKYKNDSIFKNKKTFVYYDKIDTKIEKYPLHCKNYIIYTGNFEKYQGIKEFLNVFKDIKTDIKLVLVGEPSQEIINYIKENNLQDKVILTRRLSISKTNFLIKNSLFGILPRLEGSSMKLVHYIIWDKPVLAKHTPSNQELLINKYNSYLYSNDSELKEILKNILQKNRKINCLRMGVIETKNKILKIWSYENFIRKYER